MLAARLFLGAVFGFFRLLPLSLVIALGRFWGFILRILKFRQSVIDLQLRAAYADRGKTKEELVAIRNGLYRHMGLLFAEFLRLPGTKPEKIREMIDIEGIEHLDKALERGKGVLVLSGHIGNWELACANLHVRGYKVSTISKEVKGVVGDAFRIMMRETTGLVSIPKKNSMKQIFRALKENRILVVVIDQNMTTKDGVFVDFYGHPACTMNALAVLAARTGAAVVPGACYRLPDCRRHQAIVWPEIELEMPYEEQDKNYLHNTQRFTTFTEKMIDRAPEQWLWVHKRWKTRPEGEESTPFVYKRKR